MWLTSLLRGLLPVLVENCLIILALSIRFKVPKIPVTESSVFHWMSWELTISSYYSIICFLICGIVDLGMEYRRITLLNYAQSVSKEKKIHVEFSNWHLDDLTRTHASPGLLYGVFLLPNLLSRSSYATFESHAIAWSILGLCSTLWAFGPTVLLYKASGANAELLSRGRFFSRIFPMVLVIHLIFPNPVSVVVLAITGAPSLLYCLPKAFALGEAVGLATSLALVADSMRARMTTHLAPYMVVISVMQHLAMGMATVGACSGPAIARLQWLQCGKLKSEIAQKARFEEHRQLYLILVFVIVILVTPIVTIRSGQIPWIWVVGLALGPADNRSMVMYWLFCLICAFQCFPTSYSANTQRKYFHALILVMVLPGYLWTVRTLLSLRIKW
jgi:hypothetical protein